MVMHGSVLMSPDCGSDLVNLRQARDYKSSSSAEKIIRSATRKDQFQSVEVVIRGSFHVAKQGKCFGQNCEKFELEDRELISAVKPTVRDQ